MIGQLSFCEIEQTGITEQGLKRAFLRAPIVRNLELFGQIINHVTLLISEQLSESSSDHLSFAKLSKRELQNKVPPA